MATLLDSSLIGFFRPIFMFLLIFVIIYALFTKVEKLGMADKKPLALIASLCIAVLFTFAEEKAASAFGQMLPWLVLLFIGALIIFAIYSFFGFEGSEIFKLAGGKIPLLLIALTIVAIVLVSVFQSDISPYSTSSNGEIVNEDTTNTTTSSVKTPQGETIKALTSPKLLGAIFLLVVVAATAKLIVDKIE